MVVNDISNRISYYFSVNVDASFNFFWHETEIVGTHIVSRCEFVRLSVTYIHKNKTN